MKAVKLLAASVALWAGAASAQAIDAGSSDVQTKNAKTPIALIGDLDRPELKATTDRLQLRANIHRALGHSPAVFAAFVDLTQALRFKTTVDVAERQLAILHVLQRHGGDYEFTKHRASSIAAGLLTEQQVERIADPEASIYSERQRAVLRFARRFAADPAERGDLPADHIEKYLDDRQRVELGMTLAWYLGLAHFTGALDIPDEGDAVLKAPGMKVDLGQRPKP